MPVPSISAKTPFAVHPSFNGALVLNFTQFGIGTRTITTVNTITPTPTGPTFSSLAPNASPTTGEKGQPVAIGKAATFRLTGCTVDTDYDCACNVTYSDGSTDVGVFVVQCRDR